MTKSDSKSLIVKNLSREFPTPGKPLQVLKNVNVELHSGDSLAIVGPSGSGKSTLLNILGTLEKPSSGSVQINGIDPFALSEKELAKFRANHIGFIFQDHHLLPNCTALENVLIPAVAAHGNSSKYTDRANELLAKVGLADRKTHFPAELSGGERQRIAVARAMMNAPGLLLCDEPTGNLDTTNSQSIGDLLRSAAAEVSAILIVVTHNKELADIFSRQLRMQDGQLQ